MTPSIGIVLFPHLDDSAESLLKRADAAMYRSKRDGGNRISFYEKAIQQAADERLILEKDLRQAFEAREITLAFQPQCGAGGSISGVEALARWQHRDRGMVPPPKFIGIAEEIGMIVPFGNWVLDEACSQFARLLAEDLETLPTLSVNVSALQFHDAGFLDQVLSTVQRHRLPPNCLQLELTESALLRDLDNTIGRMKKIREAGIQLSLDDFGTGYSSLSYLSRLPLDEVKIDRSFLIDAERNAASWAIIESIIDIAGALGLRVVAEGVESSLEVERLSAIGCKVFQGYHFAKPDSFDRFQSMLLDRPESQSGLVS
jgi:EAL domain-containing protein (putative c-di-GMP-specific phosphodiesterase class I)